MISKFVRKTDCTQIDITGASPGKRAKRGLDQRHDVQVTVDNWILELDAGHLERAKLTFSIDAHRYRLAHLLEIACFTRWRWLARGLDAPQRTE